MSGAAQNGASDPQAGAAGAPQAGDPAAGQAPAAATGQAPAADAQQGADGQPAGETAEAKAERLERELIETRREAASHRTKAATLEREQAKAREAGMSELERAQAAQRAAEERAAALEAQVAESLLTSAVTAEATRLGYRNPELAARLLDRSAIERDAEGRPTNVVKLLTELAKAEPYLTKGAAADYGGGANRGGQPDTQPGMSDLLKAAFGRG